MVTLVLVYVPQLVTALFIVINCRLLSFYAAGLSHNSSFNWSWLLQYNGSYRSNVNTIHSSGEGLYLLMVTVYLQGCLQFNGCSASRLHRRYQKSYSALKLIELAILNI